MKTASYIVAIRGASYVTALGVGLSLGFGAADNLPIVLVLLGIFTLCIPVFPVFRGTAPRYFVSLLWEAGLVLAIMILSNQPGSSLILFFVLIPHCARQPRPFGLTCYILFPLLACSVFYLKYPTHSGWSSLFTILPGFVALIAFGEGFWKLRITLQENHQLIDTLVAAQKLLSADQTPAASLPTGILTPREGEVLALVAKGYSNREIAERLFLAEGTVKNRVSQILEKIQVRDRTQAALRARELGII